MSADPRSRAALIAALIGFFVVTLDAVVVNVALRQISTDLHTSMAGLQWIVDGYTLLFAACLLSAGAFADRIGARRAYVIGMAVFVAASLGCGIAPTVGILIAARVVQGAAAALMLPSSMALIGEAFSDAGERARAVGLWSMGGAIASISGPVLGGLLILIDWRMIFFINLPVGAAALILVGKARPSPHRKVPLDGIGQITAILAMGALVFGTIEIGAAGATPLSIGAFVVAALASIGFVLSQHFGAHPVVPLSLFRNRQLTVAIVVGFCYMVGYFGLPFVMNLFVQQQRHLSPFESGLLFVPMMVAGAILTPFIARLSERFGARTLVVAGMALLGVGMLVLAWCAAGASVVLLAAVMILIGIAGPLVIPTITALLLSSFDTARAGTVSGIFNTSRQIGGALAVAVFGGLLASSGTFEAGVAQSFAIAAALCAVAALVALLLPRSVKRS